MKPYSLVILIMIVAIIILVGCVHTHSTHPTSLPPGQAKKLTGSKSAKPFAPGQQKKKY